MNAKRITKIDLSKFKYEKVDCQDKCCKTEYARKMK